MLDIRIDDESMDLPPGVQMEMEENNPYLQFTADIAGEYSFPIEAPATAKNIKLTKYAGVYQKRVDASGIDATVFDTGFQHSQGKLKLEKIQHNLNRGQDGRISFYYLTGTSYFWQDLKNKRLRDVALGGVRQFTWDNYNRSGNGFWGHIHKVIDAAPGTYDYCFFPALCDDYLPDNKWVDSNTKEHASVETINWMDYKNGKPEFTRTPYRPIVGNIIVPFPYLKYVLIKAVEQVGWKLEGEILNDPDFIKVSLTNLRAIDWAGIGFFSQVVPKPQTRFNIQDHVPDVTISEFLLAIRNRFGWWYEIDRINKIVTIRELKTVAANVVKDVSRKASPLITKTILTEKKIYSVRNTAEENEFKLDGFIYDGEVANYFNLPPASAALDNHVYLVTSENNFVFYTQQGTGAWHYEILASNTGDAVPAGATESITGNTIVAINYRPGLGNNYLDFIPKIEGGCFWAGLTEDTQSNYIQLTFYHGLQPNGANQLYPYAAHHIYNIKGIKCGNWSLSLNAKKHDGSEVGLYHRNFKPFLDKLITTEELEVTLYLNRTEFMALKFSDVLIINGVRMYIKTKKYLLPYKNVISLACLRIQQ